MTTFKWNDETHALGVMAIDADHRIFIAAMNAATKAPVAAFYNTFRTLLDVTRSHFQNEEDLMARSGFDDNEHRGEHRRILGEMEALLARTKKGRQQLARAFVSERLGAWLDVHIQTLDSALAAHLAKSGVTFGEIPATRSPIGGPDRYTPGAPPGLGA